MQCFTGRGCEGVVLFSFILCLLHSLWLLSVPWKILFWCLRTPGQTSCSFPSRVAEILHKLFHTSCIVCYRNNSFKFSCRVLLVCRSSSEPVTLRFFAQLNRLYLLQLALGHLWQEMGSPMWKGHMCSIHRDRVFYFYIHCDEGGLQGKDPFPDSLSIDQYRILSVMQRTRAAKAVSRWTFYIWSLCSALSEVTFCLDFVVILWNSQGLRGLCQENHRKKIGDRDWCFLPIPQCWESARALVTLVSRAGLLFQWWKGLSGVKYGPAWLAFLFEGNRKKTTHGREEKWSPFLILFTSSLTCRSFFSCVSEKLLLNSILQLKGEEKSHCLGGDVVVLSLLVSLDKGMVLRDLLKMFVCALQWALT